MWLSPLQPLRMAQAMIILSLVTSRTADVSAASVAHDRSRNAKRAHESSDAIAPGDAPPASPDCRWEQWMSWSACSRSCGIGGRMRTRSHEAPKVGGRECTGVSRQTANCNTFPCPVNCIFKTWQEWEDCSITCGGPDNPGSRVRRREYAQVVQHGGKECLGEKSEKGVCMHRLRESCPTPCEWGDWGPYEQCSLTCGTYGGMQVRERKIRKQALFGGKQCIGDLFQAQECNKVPCDIDCEWHSWRDWSACSATCGAGKRERVRDLKYKEKNDGTCPGLALEQAECVDQEPCPEDCRFSEWGEWSSCSVQCGGGEKTKKREEYKAKFGGKACVGELVWSTTCNMEVCALDSMKPGAR
eukprot:TRINITY_DN66468_c0_g1_i1.p1 TRINITY_DN66468_c0_g1~~TRINITY_DN66468_c0_g1_i1.p1  ORF type:complete len:357 (+),score=31.21 TRINITY_DN66468_c0_g1_i1:214-1284(+)